ncbi:MAG: PIN domain-containing protein [Actinobacteria bacterium]|nr:PIN domain-containing protein [Actinomycetota bacterium]
MVVVDTGPLVAVADRDDDHHDACVDWFDQHPGPVVVPAPVIVEVCWLLDTKAGPAAEAAFLSGLAGGDPRIEDLTTGDYQRAAELVDRYRDLDLGFVDASVIAVAERLGIDTVATVNHRDFRVVRPEHVDAFTLVP